MFSKDLYPVFLSLEGANCLIVGLGRVGLRKLHGILPTQPAKILVLELKKFADLDEDTKLLLRNNNITYESRQCNSNDVKNSFLVFAATSDPEENSRIAALCKQEKTLCNTATNPHESSFIVPASVKTGALCAAISTGGASPGLGKTICADIEKLLVSKTAFANFLGLLRPIALEAFPQQKHNEAFYRELISSQFWQWLNYEQTGQCLQWLCQRFPPSFHARISQILNRD